MGACKFYCLCLQMKKLSFFFARVRGPSGTQNVYGRDLKPTIWGERVRVLKAALTQGFTEKMQNVRIIEGSSDGHSERRTPVSPSWSLAPSLGHRCVLFSPQGEKRFFNELWHANVRRHYLQFLIPSFYWKNQKIWQHISYILAWHHGAEAKEGRVYYPQSPRITTQAPNASCLLHLSSGTVFPASRPVPSLRLPVCSVK